ncbi:MAG TPA: DUF4124 domain-containing protein [Rhodanobacteraceae bacterium]|nr:DUF4124 domain-containing protein [Rhodanobacteraceae bacterium]
MIRFTGWLTGLLLLAIPAAQAVQVYRCVARDGAVSYQDKPCPVGQRQGTVSLQDAPQVSSLPSPPVSSAPPAPVTSTPAIAEPPPPAPLPTMYACTRYDGQRKYLSDTLPAPYAVPLGAQGYPGRSLDRAYGYPDRLGMSAPEEARKPPVARGPLLGNAYVEVQDHCVPAPRAQVCEELRRRFDANHEKLRMAFPSDRPPLQAREDELHAQLSGC